MLRHTLSTINADTKVEERHVDEIASHLQKNSRIVDALEEDFSLRLTAI